MAERRDNRYESGRHDGPHRRQSGGTRAPRTGNRNASPDAAPRPARRSVGEDRRQPARSHARVAPAEHRAPQDTPRRSVNDRRQQAAGKPADRRVRRERPQGAAPDRRNPETRRRSAPRTAQAHPTRGTATTGGGVRRAAPGTRRRRQDAGENPLLRAIRRFQPYDSVSPDNETPAEQAEERARSPYYDWLLKAFAIVLATGLVLGLLLFLRPTVSASENRTLTQFPQFTWDSFLSGDWTKGISTWYSDTYPFRDQLIALDQSFNSLFGINTDTQMYGGVTKTDAIPDSGSTDADAASSAEKEPAKLPQDYNASDLENAVEGQVTEGLYVKDGAAYAGYGFTKEAATTYADAINTAHDALDGTTQVYSILVPNNSAVLLSDDELKAMGGSDQGQAINYYYSLYKDGVRTIDTLDTLKQHKDEYLYFRTDHHWTSLAAYYVYQKFCESKGIDAQDIADFKEVDFSGFLGSYYTKLNTPAMKQNPDTVQAWIPQDTNKMTYTDSSGNTVDWNVIRKDVKDWAANSKYSCFIGGDQPWAEIHNPKIDDGSSCLVLKESYGNSFVPWLVDHYQTVYIADFRYTTVNVADFCKEHNVNDLIVINNIQIIGSTEVAGKIQSLLTPTGKEEDASDGSGDTGSSGN